MSPILGTKNLRWKSGGFPTWHPVPRSNSDACWQGVGVEVEKLNDMDKTLKKTA
jgi:hypothetical protein